jgi:hypothetical protein
MDRHALRRRQIYLGPSMRLMIAVFVLAALLIVDFGRFNGYYTSQVGDFVTYSVGKYLR